ncbi:MAG: hypothetical protein AB7P52_13345 [Alphaproteobacteria bacterium]
MKTILKAGAALSVLALAAYGTGSNAQDPTGVHVIPLAETGDVLEAVEHGEAVGHDDLSELSGRELLEEADLTQIAAPTNNNVQVGNDVIVSDNGTLTTGLIEGATNNNGGINTFFQNSGPNASFQNSTTVQIIMGDGAGPTP